MVSDEDHRVIIWRCPCRPPHVVVGHEHTLTGGQKDEQISIRTAVSAFKGVPNDRRIGSCRDESLHDPGSFRCPHMNNIHETSSTVGYGAGKFLVLDGARTINDVHACRPPKASLVLDEVSYAALDHFRPIGRDDAHRSNRQPGSFFG